MNAQKITRMLTMFVKHSIMARFALPRLHYPMTQFLIILDKKLRNYFEIKTLTNFLCIFFYALNTMDTHLPVHLKLQSGIIRFPLYIIDIHIF